MSQGIIMNVLFQIIFSATIVTIHVILYKPQK